MKVSIKKSAGDEKISPVLPLSLRNLSRRMPEKKESRNWRNSRSMLFLINIIIFNKDT